MNYYKVCFLICYFNGNDQLIKYTLVFHYLSMLFVYFITFASPILHSTSAHSIGNRGFFTLAKIKSS